MKPKEILAWFEKIAGENITFSATGATYLASGEPVLQPQPEVAQEWITQAHSAIDSVFPEGHAVRKEWDKWHPDATFREFDWTNLRLTFKAAYRMLLDGRLSSIIDGVRAEAEDEILTQARQLANHNFLAAAAVLAGGALESHLRRLCEREQLAWQGDGSIASYDAAIAQARKQGKEIYSKADSSQVISWAHIRNDAAHTPGAFEVSKDRVDVMLDQIAAFVARVP